MKAVRASTERTPCRGARGHRRRVRPLAGLLAALALIGAAPSARADKYESILCVLTAAFWVVPSLIVDVGLTANIIASRSEGMPVSQDAAIAEVVLMPIQMMGSAVGLGFSVLGRVNCTAVLFSVTGVYSTSLLVHGAYVLRHPPLSTASGMYGLAQPLALPPPRLRVGPSRIGNGLGLSVQGAF